MTFLHPEYFWLLVIVLVIVIFLVIKHKKRSAIYNPVFLMMSRFNKKNKFLKIYNIIRSILIIIILVLLIVLLARPQIGFEEEDISKRGIDIVIALDVSESMLADDLKPNRIDAAKEVIVDFIGQLYSDRLSILVFAGKPFTQSPLTFDYEIITQYVKEISTKSINQRVRGLSGTAVGDALLSGIYKLDIGSDGTACCESEQSEWFTEAQRNKEADKNGSDEDDRSKVIILLTDGDANTGVDPVVAAKMASDKNIKIYTIGIGQKNGYPMTYIDNLGNKQIYRDRFGNVMKTRLDEETLKKIANISGGKYYAVANNKAFKEIFTDINKLEKKDIKVSKIKKYKENFEDIAWYLFISIFIFTFMEFWKPKLS